MHKVGDVIMPNRDVWFTDFPALNLGSLDSILQIALAIVFTNHGT